MLLNVSEGSGDVLFLLEHYINILKVNFSCRREAAHIQLYLEMKQDEARKKAFCRCLSNV